MRRNIKAPPISIWIAVLIVILILTGISLPYYFKSKSGCLSDVSRFNISRLNRFNDKDEQTIKPKVIAIGTSLTRNALFKDEEMESFASANGIRIKFLRFTKNRGELSDFYALTESIIDSPVDVICFESNIFAFDMKGDGLENEINNYSIYIHDVLKGFIIKIYNTIVGHFSADSRHEFHEDSDKNFVDIDLNDNEAKNRQELIRFTNRAEKFRIRKFSEGEFYKNIFRTAAERKIKIIFLDVPLSKNAGDALPETLENKTRDLLGQYQKVYGITCIHFPYGLGLEYFIDYTHLGAKGRKLYSKWFLDQIRDSLSKG
jgi:hypothetical protein